eukprot:SAG11_NODE_4673_length_1812_cov_1.518389_1_plen_77_part_10
MLSVLPSLALVLALKAAPRQQPANCSALAPAARVDCGHPGITQQQCLAIAGCCYAKGSRTVPSCYFSAPPPCEPKAC